MHGGVDLICPVCKNKKFSVKYEATYVYSYDLMPDSDAPGKNNVVEFLPFMYDSREQKDMLQYVECNTCGSKYPYILDHWDLSKVKEALKNAIK